MKRPTDQAKLLFFYLLRSSAALATDSKAGVSVSAAAAYAASSIHSCSSSSSSSSSSSALEAGHICLRLARRTDVPSIQRCNLATLPENYNSQFYVSHLRQWPDLALVAEHVVPSSASSEPNIVGYVLGKVEVKPVSRLNVLPPNSSHLDPDELYELGKLLGPPPQMEPLGHVTSLAVLQDYRRNGVAAALMEQLHVHLEECYKVKGVGLHVRKSNQAACQLYERDGYCVDQVIEGYYQDGEDAFFMRKELEQTLDHAKWRFRRERPWERHDETVRLPRMLTRYQQPDHQSLEPPPILEEDLEVMTGAM